MRDYDKVILDHYKKVAHDTADSALSTMSHEHIRNAETEKIISFIHYLRHNNKIHDSAKIADVGCGNGYTLETVSRLFPELNYTGYEYTPELREIAAKRFEGGKKVIVLPGDIRDINSLSVKGIDVLLCQRVLINLLDPNDQKQALRNLIDIVNPSGYLFFIEAFNSGLDNLNQARKEFDLEPIPPAHHNLNLEDDFFKVDNAEEISIEEFPENFLSSYYYIARVFHPVILGNKAFTRNSHFVKFFVGALGNKNIGNYSSLRIKILKKK